MSVTLVGGERLAGELAALAPVAEAIFGAGQRTPGWFARKLRREGVEARLCTLAVTGDAPFTRERVVGYALLGRAASLGDRARGAGLGLLPALRGRGLGRQLIEAACARARAHGCAHVEFLAEPSPARWYADQGFVALREELTLLVEAEADAPHPSWATSEDDLPEADAAWSWIPECWRRTPASERECLVAHWRGQQLRAWLSREGRAVLAQRLELSCAPALRDHERDELIRAGVLGLAAHAGERPLVLYPCPASARWREGLASAVLQRAFVMSRTL
ncbi:GNAT family N-acetyltransferase [Pseudenhygromyxa sp. WMMC2535]|uniref:GNAT family N-acetyltransferase n=1 Tax=Pseudenhygromyxa sp. WMMC2535 TaxID=2712867 RepID=UPI0015556E1A|nr:GNAT family N-acetyltransferase [Pseudenhygromyxa sp. WMMC2535]